MVLSGSDILITGVKMGLLMDGDRKYCVIGAIVLAFWHLDTWGLRLDRSTRQLASW